MKIIGTIGLAALAVIMTSFTPSASCADSWEMPTKQTFLSCKGHARVTVTPRDMKSQLAYFEDKVDGVEPAGQAKAGVRHAMARVETLEGKDWRPVWANRIANDVAPVEVLVRDDAAYLVTFDNWGSTGYGPNVMVIYGANGQQVRALSLTDLVPPHYIDALPHSVSSIQWRGNPYFSADGRKIVVPILIPSADSMSDKAYVDMTVDAATGTVAAENGLAWERALAIGQQVYAEYVAYEARAKAAFLAPLPGPTENSQAAWHSYLIEAVARLTKGRDFPATKVLRDPKAPDYAITETWLREALTESYADQVAVASLSASNMVPVLRRVAASVPAGSLAKVTLYVAARNDIWPAVQEAMKPTGVKLVQLDPDTPIPQVRRRIAERYGSERR